MTLDFTRVWLYRWCKPWSAQDQTSLTSLENSPVRLQALQATSPRCQESSSLSAVHQGLPPQVHWRNSWRHSRTLLLLREKNRRPRINSTTLEVIQSLQAIKPDHFPKCPLFQQMVTLHWWRRAPCSVQSSIFLAWNPARLFYTVAT